MFAHGSSSGKVHGVQALACRLGPLENGSHKLKLEIHALFHSFRASQRQLIGTACAPTKLAAIEASKKGKSLRSMIATVSSGPTPIAANPVAARATFSNNCD